MSRLARCAWVAAVALSLAGSPRAHEAGPHRLSLDQAIEVALARSPVLAAGRASLEAAEGRRVAAETYPHDPTLRVEGADRHERADPRQGPRSRPHARPRFASNDP